MNEYARTCLEFHRDRLTVELEAASKNETSLKKDLDQATAATKVLRKNLTDIEAALAGGGK